MASLTQVAIISRRGIRFSVYILIFLITVRFLFRTSVSIYDMFFPKPPPPVTVAFGTLPKLPFPGQIAAEDVTYKIETAEGEFPLLIEQLPVFFMPPISSNIKGLDYAKENAEDLGFDPNGKVIAENIPNVYYFKRRNAPSNLTINIVTGVFSISYDLSADPTVIGTIPPAPEAARIQVEAVLDSAKLLAEDLIGPPTTQFLKVEAGRFAPVQSLSESDFIKINIFRKSVEFWDEEFPSLTPTYPEGNIWFMLSGSRVRDKSIVAAEYHYFPIDEEKSSTYPTKTSEAAWEDLQEGKAFIVSPQEVSGEITVRRIYLAYYDAGQYTQFYQPVIVFEGDDNFMAFVPAVTDEYYDVPEAMEESENETENEVESESTE